MFIARLFITRRIKFVDVYPFYGIKLNNFLRNEVPNGNFPLDKLFDFSYPLNMNLPVDSIDLEAYSEGEKVVLLNRLQALLPLTTDGLNLEAEIIMQLHLAKALQLDAKSGSAPLNQKAQVSNTITAILRQLVDMQATLNTTETIKKIERVLLETLKEFPKLQTPFLKRYNDNLTP